MIPVSNVAWGPIDALRDSTFSVKWIEPGEIRRCLHPEKWIVTGEKGSGKSAIRKAIDEVHGSDFAVVAIVDFNEVEFRTIANILNDISVTTKISRIRMLSNYWQYAIIVELIKKCITAKAKFYSVLDIESKTDESEKRRLPNTILNLMEQAWNSIDLFTNTPESKSDSKNLKKTKGRLANLVTVNGLTAEFISELSDFPIDEKFNSLKNDFFDIILHRKDNIIMIFDGLDRLKTDEGGGSELSLVFESLVDALYTLRLDKKIPATLNFKALIPHDRYMNLHLRDKDKISAMQVSIKWDKKNLQEFVRKRIETSTSVKNSNFQNMWRQIMPEYITNRRYSIDEDSFEYILRHSLYRPRQIQMHFEKMSETYHNQIIDPSMVCASIAESSSDLTVLYIEEYMVDLPFIGHAIAAFHRKDNVMEYKVLRDIIVRSLNKHKSEKSF